MLHASVARRAQEAAVIRQRRANGMSRAALIRIYGADLVNWVWAQPK